MKNVKKIEQHNTLYHNGSTSFYMGLNKFADMTEMEVSHYLGLKSRTVFSSAGDNSSCKTTFLSPNFIDLPQKVDWREKGYVTPVKDQGNCGSCWSFSATGSLEGQNFHKTGILKSLSEQQLVDCSGSFGDEGCNGGLMDVAFNYIKSAGGLETEEEYPYDATEDECKFKKSKAVASVSGCVDIPVGEKFLQQAVAAIGPISVAMDASSISLYQGGVFEDPTCSSTELDHGVLAVGYGNYHGKDYWLIKNSWGASWGMDGYIMIARNENNMCGIATMASYPLV